MLFRSLKNGILNGLINTLRRSVPEPKALNTVGKILGGVGYSAFKAAPAPAPVQQTTDKPCQPGAITPEMLVALEQRAEQDPDNAKVWEELGNAFSDHGQAEDAIAAYTRALAVDPDNHDVRTDLGSAFFQAGKPELALLEFDKVLSIDPNHPQARFNKGVVLYNGLGAKQGLYRHKQSPPAK